MIFNPKEYFAEESHQFADLLIVGAGTVGIYLAHSISKKYPLTKILVIEAGGRVASLPDTAQIKNNIGKTHYGYSQGRAFGVGGTSSLWAGQLAEFSQVDIERENRKWPITYSELKKLYHQTYFDLTGLKRLPDNEYRSRLGGDEYDGGVIERFFTHWLRIPNFSRHYKDFINSNNVDIVINSCVNNISFNQQEGKFVTIDCEGKYSHKISFAKLIFTAGTLETNRFFLSTAIGGNVPWSENKLVGAYFQDHLGGTVASLTLTNKKKYRNFFENGWVDANKVQPKLMLSNTVAMNHSSSVCCHFYDNSQLTESFANIKLLIRGMRSGLTLSSGVKAIRDFFSLSKVFFPIAWHFIVERRIYSFVDGVKLYVQAEQVPIKESALQVDSSNICKDGLHPLIINWRIDGRELNAIRYFVRSVDEYLRKNQIGSLKYNIKNQDANDIALDQLSDTYHQCGGLCMSITPEGGVVDGNCKVWGTSNIYVLGASVFPSSSHANSTFTALALARRFCEDFNG
jgi:hypothetical protein